MDKVIIDSSAWIESFRPSGDKPLIHLVRNLITEDRVLMLGIIMTELLRGTKNRKEYNELKDMLQGLEYLSVSEKFWENLSLFSFELYRKGVIVPLTDTYIALLCIENSALILYRDKHFDMIAEKFPLRILKQ